MKRIRLSAMLTVYGSWTVTDVYSFSIGDKPEARVRDIITVGVFIITTYALTWLFDLLHRANATEHQP